MKKLSTTQRAQILTALVEGMSISATARMFHVSKITILRLLADAGTLAADYHDLTVCDLTTKRVQLDEIWSFIHCKKQNITADNHGHGHGDCWTWVAIDADSKLAINWLVGERNGRCANEFTADLANRLSDRVQITSDAFSAYREAMRKAFGSDVDYAQLIKEYASDFGGAGRYSPPICVAARPEILTGTPDPKHINEIFPKVVDGRDSLSGELRSIFEDHSCDHLRQQRAAVEFSPMILG